MRVRVMDACVQVSVWASVAVVLEVVLVHTI